MAPRYAVRREPATRSSRSSVGRVERCIPLERLARTDLAVLAQRTPPHERDALRAEWLAVPADAPGGFEITQRGQESLADIDATSGKA